MAENDRELVLALRAELAAIDPDRRCDRVAERAGLAPLSGVTGDGVRPARAAPARRTDPVVARLAVRLAHLHGPAERGTDPAIDEGVDLAVDEAAWSRLPEACRHAWLRGRFLAHGSLSLAGGRTHLEFVVTPREAPVLVARLAAMDLPAAWRIRRGRGVVTWKNGETVADFLGRIGAGPGLLELQARQVSRSLRGELNRVLNAESANVARSVVAAGRQLEAIARLAADGTLARQPDLVRRVAAARCETPEATITELSERLGAHRSAVQRALERIERLARHGPRRARRRGVAAPLA